ncbi:hypothetical protein DRN32_07555, partial [Thermococci archaeon]
MKEISSIELEWIGEANEPLSKAIEEHLRKNDGVTFIDIIKFLYQSVFGSYHLREMGEKMEEWIRSTLQSVEPSDEPLVEKLYSS